MNIRTDQQVNQDRKIQGNWIMQFCHRPQIATHEQFIGASSYEKYIDILQIFSASIGPFPWPGVKDYKFCYKMFSNSARSKHTKSLGWLILVPVECNIWFFYLKAKTNKRFLSQHRGTENISALTLAQRRNFKRLLFYLISLCIGLVQKTMFRWKVVLQIVFKPRYLTIL